MKLENIGFYPSWVLEWAVLSDNSYPFLLLNFYLSCLKRIAMMCHFNNYSISDFIEHPSYLRTLNNYYTACVLYFLRRNNNAASFNSSLFFIMDLNKTLLLWTLCLYLGVIIGLFGFLSYQIFCFFVGCCFSFSFTWTFFEFFLFLFFLFLCIS